MLHIISSKLFIIILLLISTIEVKAAIITLPQTGQTACYDGDGTIIACTGTGQDGELQMGLTLPNPRFVDNGDKTVTDNLTGLMWTKDCNLMKSRDPSFVANFDYGREGSVTWQSALDYIKKLNTEKYLGYNDWRLPNVNEVGSLSNHGQPTDATWLNLQIFSNLQTTGGFWSSTTDARGANSAWDVGVGSRYGLITSFIKDNRDYVWPVRGIASPSTIQKTGQNTCYSQYGLAIDCYGTGQDGELQTGVAWPVPRFTSNPDQTLTDTLTGLIWSKNASLSGSMTWEQALDYIKSINSQNYLGHNDWRLPNINELNSIGHRGLPEPGTWLNTQGFSGVKTTYLTSAFPYWSSTSEPRYYAIPGDYSLLYDGADSVWEYYSYAWPVRGGQPGSFLLTISKAGSGTGIVTGSPGIIGWNSNTGTVKYPPNTTVTLTATANNDSSFTSWSGCDSSDANSCNVTMNAAKNVTAIFTFVAFPPVNGSCGSSSNSYTLTIPTTKPTANLCATGTASEVTGTTPWTWTCAGTNGGTTANCIAGSGTVVFGCIDFYQPVCGSDGITYSNSCYANLAGVSISYQGACNAFNGACGTTNNSALSSAPTTNLCSSGTASLVTGSGPWNWTCAGSIGGFTEICSANLFNPLPIRLMGDVNGDGKIDISDALLTLQYAVNLIPHDADNDSKFLAIADVAPYDNKTNKVIGDGKVDISDALVILRRSLNLINF